MRAIIARVLELLTLLCVGGGSVIGFMAHDRSAGWLYWAEAVSLIVAAFLTRYGSRKLAPVKLPSDPAAARQDAAMEAMRSLMRDASIEGRHAVNAAGHALIDAEFPVSPLPPEPA